MIRWRLVQVTAVLGGMCAVGCSESAPMQTAQPIPMPMAPPAGPPTPPVAPPASATAGTGAGMQSMPSGMSTMMTPPSMNPTPPVTGAQPPPVGGAGSEAPPGGEPVVPTGPATGNCEGGSLMPGDSTMSVEIGGQNRSFLVHVPPMYDGKTPMALMVNLHPLTGSGSGQRSGSGWAQLGDTEGIITVFPNGIGGQWDIGGLSRSPEAGDNDRKLVVASVEEVAKIGCVDRKRVYASGYSMGGGLTHYVGCEEAGMFAAIAPSAFDIIEENMPCEPVRPLTVIMFRGRGDGVVPWEPSVGTLTGCCATFLGAEGCFAEWAKIDGCTDEPMDIGNNCRKYSQCMAGTTVTLCENGGHTQGDARLSWDAIKDMKLP
jgi:polyhydroxybutyrate depolymerase